MEIPKNTLEYMSNTQSIESDLAYTKVLGVISQYILWSVNLWHSLSSSLPKRKQIV